MMQIKQLRLLIRSVGGLIAVSALYGLLPSLRSWYYYVTSLAFSDNMESMPVCALIFGVALDLIVLLKLPIAYALIRLRQWGRVFGVYVLVADAFIRLYGASTAVIWVLHDSAAIAIPSSGNVIQGTLYPSLAIALLSIMSAWVLSRGWIKTGFGERGVGP